MAIELLAIKLLTIIEVAQVSIIVYLNHADVYGLWSVARDSRAGASATLVLQFPGHGSTTDVHRAGLTWELPSGP